MLNPEVDMDSDECMAPNSGLASQMVHLASTVKELQTQAHLIHFNYEGENFLSVHRFLKKQYEMLLEEFDTIGEYVRSLDYMMPMCACGLKDMMHQSFKNVSSYDGKEMLVVYLMNLELVCEIAMEIEKSATDLRALDIANYLGEICGKMNKASWMVKATLRCV
tara:strand:- start:93 stop:584 length:492 start_codon:yes stop_codon:yes gene_type:complete